MTRVEQSDGRFVASLQTVRRSMILAFVLFAQPIANAHAAIDSYPSRDVGGWTVAASKDGKGCFLTRRYERPGETTLLLGLDTDSTNHISVLNGNWSIKPKDRLKLTFRLSMKVYPRQFAVGMTSDGKQGFVTAFEPAFLSHFAASPVLNISRGDVPVERLPLDASGMAIAELRKCVDVQRTGPAAASGKERSDRIPNDPFAPSQARRSRK